MKPLNAGVLKVILEILIYLLLDCLIFIKDHKQGIGDSLRNNLNSLFIVVEANIIQYRLQTQKQPFGVFLAKQLRVLLKTVTKLKNDFLGLRHKENILDEMLVEFG